MPYRDKELEKKKKHELYLRERELLKQAKLAAGIPLDRRGKPEQNKGRILMAEQVICNQCQGTGKTTPIPCHPEIKEICSCCKEIGYHSRRSHV
jgi:hypothetical protein